MSTEQIDQSGGDRRTAFRCAADATYETASLKIERVEYPAQLLDESAGGFAIRVQGPLAVKANDLVWIHTNSGWFQVRVANVAEDADAEAGRSEEGNRERKGDDQLPPTFRLGLQRLRDVEPWDDPTTHTSWFSRLPLVRLHSRDNPLALFGTGTLTLIGVIVLAAGLFMWQAGYPVADLFNLNRPRSSSHGSVLPQLGKHISKSLRSATKTMPTGMVPDSATRSASPTNPAKQASLGDYKSSLRGMIDHLSGTTVFALPAIVEALSLTDAQQAEIRQITDASSEALRHIDRYWKAGNRHEQAQARAELHKEARQYALEVLTAEQRKKWDELAGGR